MKKNNLIRFAQSLVLLPMITSPLALGSIQSIEASPSVLVQKINIEAGSTITLNKVTDTEAELLKAKAEAIDAYFSDRDMPLAGMGIKMVEEAEKNGLDWRLLPAIAVRESTGGKFACKKATFNPFGWGSCKIGFKSNEHAIEIVAKNLGGNNPNTARHYEDKDTKVILRAYNPPSIAPRYAEQVMNIMNTIGPANLGTVEALAKS
ncbi:glucosaminidase domain-containing protein [Candidatus Nomurabacteria bacterium]|nr:glucosaminidase domain-containing protein [Candidatus Nomurabacteria bacterium]